MDQSPDAPDQTSSSGAAPSTAPRATLSVDVVSRPDPGWLDDVQREIDDVDLVLKCLARDSSTICRTCEAVIAAGELDARPVLARCAATKEAR